MNEASYCLRIGKAVGLEVREDRVCATELEENTVYVEISMAQVKIGSV